jgi:hypothetical protein
MACVVLPIKEVTALNPRSSTLKRLIDENVNLNYESKKGTVQPWVQLELSSKSVVNVVEIINRPSYDWNRLSEVEVRVGNEEVTPKNTQGLSTNKLCGKYKGPGKRGQVVRIQCDEAITGKYVTIQIKDKLVKVMSIAEVAVIGRHL